MVILGVDPGSSRIGYGAIKKENGALNYLGSGLIELKDKYHEKNLVALEKNFEEILRRFSPLKVGLEKLFFVKNQKSALLVAEARGVILNTAVKRGISVLEVGPSEVKLAVTGDGRAPKKAVAKMVNYFLNIRPDSMIDDVSDALAIAITVSDR